ncbi:MAG: substrate-binding domain-containing protein [Chloroflexi bacterium]|nr:substrate-binding domain-containing protein [Chloroflexota bacterium]
MPIVLVFLLAACASQPLTVTREPVSLRLVSADSCGPLAEQLAAVYEETYPWITVQVEVWNSALAEETLRTGGADGSTELVLSEAEGLTTSLALLSWLGKTTDEEPLWSHPFARDGIAIIVHPATPLTETGLAHLQEIFRGRVQEWGGMVLTVVSREEGSGTRAAFDSAVLGGYDVTPTGVVMPSSEAVVEYVAQTPGAIGYVSTAWVDDRVRVLPVEGVLPTPATIADGSYPLSRPLYLATTVEPAGEVREFAQWVLEAGKLGNW